MNQHVLRTIGHATMIVLEDGQPLVATDPWLVGSVYWRSWWLEKYPTKDEIDLVRRAKHLYITHSHPDHFHPPSLREIGPRPILNPRFPKYQPLDFLNQNGFPATVLEPFQWYQVTPSVRMASVPMPIDDSMLIVDTPYTTVVNCNDSMPRIALLEELKRRLLTPGKRVVMLKSHSPASAAAALYRRGERALFKSKKEYAQVVQRMGETLGASHFIPFASQAFFNRRDSVWANEFKVIYEDLAACWQSSVTLCKPFVTMDLKTAEFTSDYDSVSRRLTDEQLAKVTTREEEEESFSPPADFEQRLKKYLDEVYFLRLFFRHGIGWRLATSKTERFYNSRTGTIESKIPDNYDMIIELPDRVLYEALQNNILTDLGITMFIKVDTQVPLKLTYGAFLLMGLHDYGHFDNPLSFSRFVRFYLPYFVPALFKVKGLLSGKPLDGPPIALGTP